MLPSARTLRAVQAAVLAAVLALSALAHGSWVHVRFEHHGRAMAALHQVPAQDQNHVHSHDEDNLAEVDQAGEPQGSSAGHDGAHHHVDADAAWPPAMRGPEPSGEQVRPEGGALTRWALYPPDRPPCLPSVS
jgi:hypothetical protein